MKEEKWTLAMAAAWFIWRAPDAVRDQWNPARKLRKVWVAHRALKGRRQRPRWRLKGFGRANLADVFAHANLQGDRAHSPEPAGARMRNPRQRLKEAVQSGELIATHGRQGKIILKEYWERDFDLSARSPRPTPKPGPARQILVEPWAFLQENLARVDQKLAAMPAEIGSNKPNITEAVDELPDLGPDLLEPTADDPQTSSNLDATTDLAGSEADVDDEDEIYVKREHVQDIEEKLSRREYHTPDWDLGQTLGWIAYRNETHFRSLWAADLNPPPTYYGKSYSTDFAADDGKNPAAALRVRLIGGSLKGIKDKEAIAKHVWLEMTVWECPEVKFARADVCKVWKKIDPTTTDLPRVKRKCSNERAEEIYWELYAEIGGHAGVNRFFDRAKGEGVTMSQAKRIKKDLDPSAKTKGRKISALKA